MSSGLHETWCRIFCVDLFASDVKTDSKSAINVQRPSITAVVYNMTWDTKNIHRDAHDEQNLPVNRLLHANMN
jgi:hypothetical protein